VRKAGVRPAGASSRRMRRHLLCLQCRLARGRSGLVTRLSLPLRRRGLRLRREGDGGQQRNHRYDDPGSTEGVHSCKTPQLPCQNDPVRRKARPATGTLVKTPRRLPRQGTTREDFSSALSCYKSARSRQFCVESRPWKRPSARETTARARSHCNWCGPTGRNPAACSRR
jgi:hypothetical protein